MEVSVLMEEVPSEVGVVSSGSCVGLCGEVVSPVLVAVDSSGAVVTVGVVTGVVVGTVSGGGSVSQKSQMRGQITRGSGPGKEEEGSHGQT